MDPHLPDDKTYIYIYILGSLVVALLLGELQL